MLRGLITALIASSALTCAAAAADKPAIGPAPAWVQPVARPGVTAGVPAEDAEAPVRLLLTDQQVFLEKGRQTIYSEIAVRIQTPQGLAAGNISLPWRPDTSDATVHKLLVRRGKETIDVLASGQTFTVMRREQNLENAALDGVLTANIQPAGLQVGDVIEFAVSIASSDPVMQGHVEHVALVGPGPVDHARLRIQWPDGLPARVRHSTALPPLKPVSRKGISSVEVVRNHLEPVLPVKHAPMRFNRGRIVEVTDFASWAEVGALLAPLFKKAAAIPPEGALAQEVERIRTLSDDPKVRAEAALALVQDKVRYVFMAMGNGNLVPADATETWSRRYGDCKGKTALLLGLLTALGIEAEPVAVNAMDGDGIDARLPMVGLFNHVLVRAKVHGRTYWLDGTRTGDTSLDRVAVPDVGWGLPLIADGATLVRMVPAPLETPSREMSIHIDASAGLSLPAPVKAQSLLRGDQAVAAQAALSSLTGEARERALKEFWKDEYDFVEAKSVQTAFDAKAGEMRLTVDGVARMKWDEGWYKVRGTNVGYRADFAREKGADATAPYVVPYPYFNRVTETVVLPDGFSKESLSKHVDVAETVAGIEYLRRATFQGNSFTIEKSERSVVPEFPASEAAAAQARLRALNDLTVYLRRPAGYRPTEKEFEALLAAIPAGASGYRDRASLLMSRSRYEEAVKDLDRAIALNPRDEWALASRGFAKIVSEDFEAGAKDIDAALAIDKDQPMALRGRGLLAQRDGDAEAAVAAFTAALRIDPQDSFTLGKRAIANRQAGHDEAALSDSEAALKLTPGWTELYLLRANLLRKLGKPEQGLAEAAALQSAMPNDDYAQVGAAKIYLAFGARDKAKEAFDRAIALAPKSYIYLNRSQLHAKQDVAARRADLEMALRLEPGSLEALKAKARLQEEVGEFAGAAATYSTMMAQDPDDLDLLVGRGLAYLRTGDRTRSDKDFASARARATTAAALNSICWVKAIAGAALEMALEECNMALAKQPDSAATLDSRAMVLLKLGRLDEAIADYDRAIARRPRQAESLFGRAVAFARKGEKAKAEAGVVEAEKFMPAIREVFEGYGLTL
ncbi:DUF3857 domain-containing protein [Sphingosinicella sp. LY1275]|uniref:DUF3857 domain-containing protein n=1 Tax=Sphingosinicella sp. LY1275 TaxID=3095379 RepID=UPI002ADEB243|nr:DUF3857 domain-containing protein [Sphingosinicella sp. LY1275]MEA1015864.1 tetratricopeptide repeat protein [Sphingosinicella sp. LY1275]